MAISERNSRGGSTRYQVRVQDEIGRWYPAKTFNRKIDAERHERELLSRRDQGEAATPAKVRAMTVASYSEKWKEERRSRVSEGWRISQDQMLRDYVLPAVGDKPLLGVRSEHIGRILRQMEDAGRGGQTRLHVFQLVQSMFGDAVEYYGFLTRSPVMRRDRPQVIEAEQVFLTPDQTRTLLARVKGEYIGPAVWLAVLASLRPNEVQALRFQALDFDRNEIHIVAGFKRKAMKIEPYPKGKRAAVKPMVPELKAFLLELREGKAPADFVVAGISEPMLAHTTFYKHVVAVCKRMGLPRITPHGLRRCSTELWVEAGATEEDVIRLLDHSGAGAVRRYMHRDLGRLHRMAGSIQVASTSRDEASKLRVVR